MSDLLIIAGLFLGGLLLGLLGSMGYMPLIGLEKISFDAYRDILTSKTFYFSFLLTFYIAFSSTVISCLLGVGVALLLRQNFVGRSIIKFLFQYFIK